MVFAFDSLGYAKRLKAAGVPEEQADAQAEAARDFIMAELVTKTDLQSEIGAVRRDLDTLRREIDAKLENLTLRLTVRLGFMLGAAVAILAAIIKLGA